MGRRNWIGVGMLGGCAWAVGWGRDAAASKPLSPGCAAPIQALKKNMGRLQP